MGIFQNASIVLTSLPQMEINFAAHNSSSNFPEYTGYIAAGISCFFFGSNLLPVKQYEVGDGEWVSSFWG